MLMMYSSNDGHPQSQQISYSHCTSNTATNANKYVQSYPGIDLMVLFVAEKKK